ncbi:MAG: histidine phosphatase family protein [Pseudomonadota bacterium]
MKSLLFLRHAKSSWSSPELADHDRPLNGRGRAAAALMGRYIVEHDLLPELILCSTARRARETLERAATQWTYIPAAHIERALYDFSGGRGYLDLFCKTDNQIGSLMVIGHNPTIEILVSDLMGEANPELAEKLAYKYPTAGLAVLEFDTDDWAEIAPGRGKLTTFALPRELEE